MEEGGFYLNKSLLVEVHLLKPTTFGIFREVACSRPCRLECTSNLRNLFESQTPDKNNQTNNQTSRLKGPHEAVK